MTFDRYVPAFLVLFKASDYIIEFKEDAKSYHAKPFPIPTIHEPTLKKENTRLFKIGVLKKMNNSQWAAPTFNIPKKNGTVRFISDFRELNNTINSKPFPIPKHEGFRYATSLDLTIG